MLASAVQQWFLNSIYFISKPWGFWSSIHEARTVEWGWMDPRNRKLWRSGQVDGSWSKRETSASIRPRDLGMFPCLSASPSAYYKPTPSLLWGLGRVSFVSPLTNRDVCHAWIWKVSLPPLPAFVCKIKITKYSQTRSWRLPNSK